MDITKVHSAASQASQIRQGSVVKAKTVARQSTETPETGQSEKPMLSGAEKEYFASAFPASAKEIRQHVVYQKNGTQVPVSLGTTIDRRG